MTVLHAIFAAPSNCGARRLLLAACCASVALVSLSPGGRLHGQVEPALPGLERAQSENAPEAPADPATADVRAALVRTRAELADLESQVAAEQRELLDRIVAESAELSALHDAEAELLARQRQVLEDLEETDRKLFEAESGLARAREAVSSTAAEIEAQAIGLKERLVASLVAIESPERIAALDAILAEGSVLSLGEKLDSLLATFLDTLNDATTASSFRMPLTLSGTEGRVEQVQVLRLGLLGGYYAHPSTSEAGFVLADASAAGEIAKMGGLSSGLSNAQRMSIARFVEDPSQAGFLPMDVTGGSGLSTLQSRRSLAQWFEVGGVFMWPLLLVAAVSLIMIIERAFTLGFLSLGIRRRVQRVLALVESERYDEAEDVCARMRGPTGSVCHAAIVHRDTDRSVLQDAVQEALLHEAPKFQARLPFIALCAAVAPLIGLLGTVTGMILTFKMVTLFGTADPRFMAGGISEALITTQGGLYVAIPSLLMRGILGSVADRAMGTLETGAMTIVLALLKGKEAPEEEPLEIGAAS